MGGKEEWLFLIQALWWYALEKPSLCVKAAVVILLCNLPEE